VLLLAYVVMLQSYVCARPRSIRPPDGPPVTDVADLSELPAGLPVPKDDGAAAHLPGLPMPKLSLPSTEAGSVSLSRLEPLTVLYFYPMTGRPTVPLPEGWDRIPGARGCTPEACAFRDHYAELLKAGAMVYGISSQSTEEQREAVVRLGLPFPLLSDEQLEIADAMRLPTFEIEGRRLFKRLTLVVRDGSIEHVFYPVFPPDRHAGEVLTWLYARESGKRPAR
jgi:peroxiredoxin